MTRARTDIALPESLPATHPDYGRERYDVQQAAVYLQIGRSEVYAHAKAGRIAHGKRSQRIYSFIYPTRMMIGSWSTRLPRE